MENKTEMVVETPGPLSAVQKIKPQDIILNLEIEVRVCLSDALRPHRLYPARLFCSWNSPGKNTGVGCHFLLQGIFPTQGLNPHLLCLLHCRQILYTTSATWEVMESLRVKRDTEVPYLSTGWT